MIYLTKNDLIVNAYERFIDESSSDMEHILIDTEARAVAYVKSVLGLRYDMNLLFDPVEPIRNELIIQILCRIVIYNIIRRNAARKVPTDFKEDYDDALKLLKEIATGVTVLSDVPAPTDENGNPTNTITMFGNNTNKNFYI
jgi:phage gp36-like protein